MKKNIKSVTTSCDHTAEDLKMLTKLNGIFKKNQRAYAKLRRLSDQDEFDAAAVALVREDITRLSRQFDDLVACLPKVKFNNTTGEYMFKYDENGQERFCVRIDVSRVYEVTLSAKNWKDAKRQADNALRENMIALESEDVKFTDMSGAAN